MSVQLVDRVGIRPPVTGPGQRLGFALTGILPAGRPLTGRPPAQILLAGALLGWLLAWLPTGQVPADELWTHPAVRRLPTDALGPFVELPGGRILSIETTATRISEDGGRSWSEPRPLFPPDSEHAKLRVSNERALLRTRSGTLVAAFMNLAERHWTWDNALHDAPGARLPTYVMRSLDEGRTWQDVHKLHDAWSGAVRDMLETPKGRIVFTAMRMQHDPGRHSVLTYGSDDDGVTWRASNVIDLGGRGHHGGVTEPTIEQLKDGRLWMLIRTNWGEFWSAYSSDEGRYWRVLQPSGIAASSAPGLLKRLGDGRLVLLWNRPFPEGKSSWPLSGGDGLWSDTPVSNHRLELSIAWSADEGRSWTEPLVIARHPKSWVAYPYLLERSNGELWLTTMQGQLRVAFRPRDLESQDTGPREPAGRDRATPRSESAPPR